MIKVEGENKTKYSDAIIYSYVYSAREYAVFSLKHFFDLLNINKDAFNHLYNIDIVIDYNDKLNKKNTKDLAYYEDNNDKTGNNRIIILPCYIENLLNSENKLGKKYIIKDLGETIIHEMLHSNRDLMLKDGNNIFYYDNLKKYYLLKSEYKKIYDECERILFDYYNECYEDKYMIILKIVDRYKYISVYVYDKIFNEYKVYNLSNIKYENNFYNLYTKVINYLDKYDVEADKVIPDYKLNSLNNVYGIINLYTNNKGIKNYDDVRKAYFFLNYQYALEEALIEALTLIISYHKGRDALNIKDACADIKYRRKNAILKNGCNIFENADVDFIKWFLLSTYSEEYNDLLERMFNDKYIELIKNFSILFENKENPAISKRSDVKINEIITQKLVLKNKN